MIAHLAKWWRFVVNDAGLGFSAANLNHIFDTINSFKKKKTHSVIVIEKTIQRNHICHFCIVLHIKGRLPVLLCAVKTVEGDFRFCWTITPNVGQTHKENPNLVRILYMLCTLNDIYKQYNKLHEYWYTKISSLRCVADRNPPQNASDLYTKYWSYAEHCRPCTRLSGVNWWKQKQITLIVPIGYSLFADHRSVPSSGPGFV